MGAVIRAGSSNRRIWWDRSRGTIAWNLGYFKETIDTNPDLKYDLVYNLQRNDFKTSSEILLIIEDIKGEL